MPKMKTHKGTAKRFRRTGTGKLMRGFRKEAEISAADAKVVNARLAGK